MGQGTLVDVIPRCRRPDPAHDGRPRRTTGGRRAMGIRKQHALGCQPIHVRRLGLRIALKRVRPVIQIIDRNE